MATTPTQKPVPSESPIDLKYNAGKIDEFVTSMGWTYTDRFGNKHYTIEGLRWLAQQAISQFGYITLDSFEDGNTITLPNQVLRLDATGEYYRWDGPLPKMVPEGSTPESTGGVGIGKWLSVGDASLRSQLASVTGFNLVGQVPDVTTLRNTEPTTASQRILLREYTAGTGYGGGQLRSVLDGSAYTDNGVTVFKTPGGAAWIRINADVITSFMAGAVPDNGVTDNTAAINRFLLAGKKLVMGDGIFGHSGQITMQNGINLDMSGAVIKPSSTLLIAAWRGDNLSDVKVTNVNMEGTGLDNTTGNGQLMLFVNCQRCIVDSATFTKSPNDGLRFIGCTRCIASNVISYNNLSVGIQDRDGDYNTIIGCKCSGNGNTGLASSTGGRGILTWRSVGTKIIACDAFNNTEYNIRAYSQAGDSRGSSQILISDPHVGDAGKIDIYIYNEIGSLAEIVVSNPMVRRTTQPEGAMIALQGTRVSCNGGSLVKSGDRLTVPCFSLFQTDSAAVRGVTVGNVGQLFSFSSANNTLITGLIANCATVCGTAGGNGSMYKGNSFIHGGSGVSDVAIDAGTDPCSIISNVFAGFWRNISWNSQKMTISDNESSGTTELSMRMFGDGIGNLYMGPNRWDTASNPTLLASLQKQGGPTALPVWYADAAPTSTSLTNPVGSRVLKATPVVGQPKGWLCTVSGAPGTWVAESNL
ncbi:TPA: right-handed parallel beta-helix repeat-containing protein [Enterobacter hormaechei]